jgi:hypothetical protein
MQNTILLSEARLKAFTDLNDYVDPELLKSAIREAQIIHLTRVLGTRLYNKIMTDVDNNTLTQKYRELIDNYILDYLLYATYFVALEYIWLRPRNNGLLQPNGGDNANSVDMVIYDKKRTSVESKMEYFGERLVDHLTFNTQNYPEYTQAVNDEIPADMHTQYGSPFVFRNRVPELVERMGIKVVNSRYKYLPQ